MQQIVFLILTILSHIGASLFFAKPRFNKIITVAIWLLYVTVFFVMPPDSWFVSYFISFALHLALFFVTTTGRMIEKGFLFFSYATIYTCFNTLFNIINYNLIYTTAKIILTVFLAGIMQLILYAVLLPSFKKVAIHIKKGWGIFYGVVLSFWGLIITQSLFSIMKPINQKEIIVFLLTIVAFCVACIAVFKGMNSVVELSYEKQKTLHTELLQAQVDSQAKEAEHLRRNRHDLRHHYQMLLSLASNGETDKIIEYVKLQSESIDAMTTGRFCENETINNTLKVYHQKATQKNITMDIRAAVKPDLSVPSPAIVTVVANILENALHGAVESKSKTPEITVTIKHKAGRLVINCENTCISSLSFDEMPEHLHGIGVNSIISTAEKYNGSCRFSAKDSRFCCKVIMDE